jgi:hypothetical protein
MSELTETHFSVRSVGDTNRLFVERYATQVSLILFYSTACPHCEPVKHIFEKLPNELGGCEIGMIDIGVHKSVVGMSSHTDTPITYTPRIAVYRDGMEFAIYEGGHSTDGIITFVIESANQPQLAINDGSEQPIQQPIQQPSDTIDFAKPSNNNSRKCYLKCDGLFSTK